MSKNSHKDAWKIFRILSEFVDGFENMSNLVPSVCVFGSARTTEADPYYQKGIDLAEALVAKKFGIITGGGGGAMESANRGAQQAKGSSCGVCIDLPMEDEPNRYIDRSHHLHMRYFFVRKVLFVRYAQAFVFMPGGYGTLDELFEALTLIQTEKIRKIPLFLFGSEYWEGMVDWIKNKVLKEGKITDKELSLFEVTDDIDFIASSIESHYNKTQQETTFDLDQS